MIVAGGERCGTARGTAPPSPPPPATRVPEPANPGGHTGAPGQAATQPGQGGENSGGEFGLSVQHRGPAGQL